MTLLRLVRNGTGDGFITNSGDDIRKAPPVPIPNTEVKLSEPMIVETLRK